MAVSCLTQQQILFAQHATAAAKVAREAQAIIIVTAVILKVLLDTIIQSRELVQPLALQVLMYPTAQANFVLSVTMSA